MNDHDNTDYDGMGNHGRFPPEKKEEPPARPNNTGDLLLIVGVIGFVVTYLLIR